MRSYDCQQSRATLDQAARLNSANRDKFGMQTVPTIEPQLTIQEESAQDVSKFASEAVLSLVGKIFGKVVTLLSQIVVARILGPAVYGLYAIGLTMMRLIQIFGPLGLDNAVIWFGSRYYQTEPGKLRHVILRILTIGLIFGAGLSLLFFLSAPFFSSIYTQPDLTPIIRWFSVSFVFINLVRIASSATRITQKVKYSIFIDDLIQPVLYFSLVVLFYLLGNKLLGALVANVISFSIAALTALYIVFRQFYKGNGLQREFSYSYQSILLFSMPTAFTGVLGAAHNWIDRLLIGFFRPAADIGVYQAASQSSMLFVIILTAISTIFGPMIADLFHKAEHARLRRLYQTSTRWGFYLGLPIFVVVCFYAQEIMTIVFGAEYASGAVPMLILNIGQMFNLSTGTVGFLLIMTGNQNKWLGVSGISLVINIVLNLILTYYFGIVGTAIATAFSIFILYTGGIILTYRTLQVFPYERKMLKGIGAAVVSMLVLLVINWVLPGHEEINFLLGSVIICFVFLVCLFRFGLEKEDWIIFQMFKSKLQNKL